MRVLIASDSPCGLNCYTPDTQVLTDHGWIPFPQVRESDQFATISPSGDIVYQHPSHIIVSHYNGPLYRVQGHNIDLAVTSNHNLYFRPLARNYGKDRWKHQYVLRKAESVFGKPKKFKKDGLWNGIEQPFFVLQPMAHSRRKRGGGRFTVLHEPYTIPMDDWLRFLGYYIAEGSVNSSTPINGGHTIQIRQSLGRHYSEMYRAFKVICEYMGTKVWGNGSRILTRNQTLWEYLTLNVGRSHYPHNRRIPREFMSLSRRQLTILRDAIALGDGHVDKRNHHMDIFTSCITLRDDLQELALKTGSCADYSVFHPKGKEVFIRSENRKTRFTTDHYRVSFKDDHPEPVVDLRPTIKEWWDEYNGLVYCVEVPQYHTLYVRRNGKVVWCGNTGYSNLSRNLAVKLTERNHDVGFISFQHLRGKLFYHVPTSKGFVYLPHYGCADDIGRGITAATKDFKPDMVFHIRDYIAHDSRVLGQAAYSLKKWVGDTKVWGWIPVQQTVLPYDYVEVCIPEYDYIVAMAKAGMHRFRNMGFPYNRIDYLVPGISETYSHQEGPVKDLDTGKVPVVMNVGLTTDPRKMIALLPYAYSKVMGKVNLWFYLHGGMHGYYDFPNHVRASGTSGHWLFPDEYPNQIGYPEETLASLYRAASAYIQCGTGEGAGMPLQESASMGLPLIYGALETSESILQDYKGEKYPVKTHLWPKNKDAEEIMDVDHLGEVLAKVPEMKKNLQAGREYYQEHSWDRTVERFLTIAKREGF